MARKAAGAAAGGSIYKYIIVVRNENYEKLISRFAELGCTSVRQLLSSGCIDEGGFVRSNI